MGQHIDRQCGGIQLLVAAQLRNVCVQKVCVIHGVKQELAPPTGLLQSKAQLLADAAGTDRIFGKKDQIIRLQSLAKAVGQRIQPYKFIAVCRNMMLLEQIAGGNDFFGFCAVADQRNPCTGMRFNTVKRVAGTAQCLQCRFLIAACIADRTGPTGFTDEIG